MHQNEGWVYVNGKLGGESHNEASPTFNAASITFIAGENTIAVRVKCNDATGGIGDGSECGVNSEPGRSPLAAQHVQRTWHRSSCNPGKEPGRHHADRQRRRADAGNAQCDVGGLRTPRPGNAVTSTDQHPIRIKFRARVELLLCS